MLSIIKFLISSLLCVTTAKFIKNDNTKIIDIVHNNFKIVNYHYISDFLVFSQVLFGFIKLQLYTIKEIFLIMSVIQVLRSICAISTVLPPLKNYRDKIRFGGINGYGTEYIFSGHASYSAIFSLYLYSENILGFYTLFLYNCISQFLIVVSRNHYTVDVLLAWIIVPLLYSNLQFCKRDEHCFELFQQLV
jgi:hypothetical protein